LSEKELTEIKEAIQNDIGIYFKGQAVSEGWGCFAVPELVFGYCDFLGALYTRCLKMGTLTKRAVKFIEDFLGEVNSRYKKYAEIIYDMYRHGTVHSFRPKTYLIDEEKISWLVGKGLSEHLLFRKVSFQEKAQGYIADYFLILDIRQLYLDLLAAVDLLIKRLRIDLELAKRSEETYKILGHEKPRQNIYPLLRQEIENAQKLGT